MTEPNYWLKVTQWHGPTSHSAMWWVPPHDTSRIAEIARGLDYDLLRQSGFVHPDRSWELTPFYPTPISLELS